MNKNVDSLVRVLEASGNVGAAAIAVRLRDLAMNRPESEVEAYLDEEARVLVEVAAAIREAIGL